MQPINDEGPVGRVVTGVVNTVKRHKYVSIGIVVLVVILLAL